MARADQALICGNPLTALPTKTTDSSSCDQTVRLNGYGEVIVRDQSLRGLAEEGTLLLATNPTISTGLTWVAAQTTFSDTTPNFYIYNPEAVGGKSLRLHWLKMVATAAGTSATGWHYAAILDSVGRAITTDNTLAITPVNPNGGYGNIISPTIKAQNSASASVIAASSASKRIVARGGLGGLNIAGDEIVIAFGDIGGTNGALAEAAGQPGRRVVGAPPIVIQPQGSLVIHIWGVASAAAFNPEFELLMSAK